MSTQPPSTAAIETAPPIAQPAEPPPPVQMTPPVSRGRRKAFFVFFLVVTLLTVAALFFWLHVRQFESTDDAQVDAHLNPVSARIDGTITRVYVDDNQTTKAGDPLIDLDERDYQVALDQAVAQLAQARSIVIALQPNVPITEIAGSTNITGGEAEVANAEAMLASAERDRESAAAKLAEAAN